ncbi:MAG TPA: alpha/beta hydrolase [Acidimicrobiales bacterium]|nr:alpha/beta hydrolase [Acidimicrobiales bacterium]
MVARDDDPIGDADHGDERDEAGARAAEAVAAAAGEAPGLAQVIPIGGDAEVPHGPPARLFDASLIGVPADPIIGPEGDAPETPQLVAVPRLARHEIVLDDDHRVGVAVCGRGLPVVLVHGFTAEGILYAQTLSRLVAMGFKVVAVDVAGHGATQGLPTGGDDLASYTRLLGRVLDELGVRRAVFAGHSMGGRLVTQLAAAEPDRAIAVVLIDAVVGACWDRLIGVSRFVPPVMLGVAALLVADTLSTLPWLRNPAQAAKLGRLVGPTLLGHARRPWRMLGPAISMMRSSPSGEMLEALAAAKVPVVVIHGDRDMPVPYQTAVDAARRSGGTLVTVKGGTHSWVLKDPETLPAIIAELLDGPLARVRAAALGAAGLATDASSDQVEAAFLGPHAWVRRLTPPIELRTGPQHHHQARYRWTVEQPA